MANMAPRRGRGAVDRACRPAPPPVAEPPNTCARAPAHRPPEWVDRHGTPQCATCDPRHTNACWDQTCRTTVHDAWCATRRASARPVHPPAFHRSAAQRGMRQRPAACSAQRGAARVHAGGRVRLLVVTGARRGLVGCRNLLLEQPLVRMSGFSTRSPTCVSAAI